MARELVFYCLHYDNEVSRVQLVRNMGVIESEEPARLNGWESIRRKEDAAVGKWINDGMCNKTCAVVLLGSETSQRPWVNHEIKRAWETKKGLLGIYIHGLE